ncbi:MAG TPA: GtrA family protein [Candidatus Saccharimonadales bacterium]|nr:GtrA family protein [Candidatus Saccharimonadales bacterium]
MERAINLGKKMYNHSFVRYLVIGGSTFGIDFFLLVFLHAALGVRVLVAASISYWTSIVFNFLMNRFWTFDSKDSPLHRHMTFYGLLLAVNYGFTVGFIGLLTHVGVHYTIAKVIAVAIQMIWTYLAYKKVVFR